MKKRDYNALRREFDSLEESDQWIWAANYKAEIELDLDNDNTTFTFNEEAKTDECTLFIFKADIGNRWGIPYLLNSVGFIGYNV